MRERERREERKERKLNADVATSESLTKSAAFIPQHINSLPRELMHDESLREQQITAANKFLSLLDPRQREDAHSIRNPAFEYTPSVVAASAVLSSTMGTSV